MDLDTLKNKTLAELETLIQAALDPRELFGADPEKALKNYRIRFHESFGDNAKQPALATHLFQLIGEKADAVKKPFPVITSPKRAYMLKTKLATGDVSDVHYATSESGQYIFKASRVNGGDTLLEREKEAVSAVLAKLVHNDYFKLFPTLAESFVVKDRIRKRVNVFSYEPGWLTLETIVRKTGPLDEKHVVWMFKRLLSALGCVRSVGYVHGAVLPQHILIHPATHSVRLIGWTSAVKRGNPLTVVPRSHLNFYPPEVTAKKPATSAVDVYLAAKSLWWANSGAQVQRQLWSFLSAFLLPGATMRGEDPFQLYDEFDEKCHKIFGPPKFVPLVVE